MSFPPARAIVNTWSGTSPRRGTPPSFKAFRKQLVGLPVHNISALCSGCFSADVNSQLTWDTRCHSFHTTTQSKDFLRSMCMHLFQNTSTDFVLKKKYTHLVHQKPVYRNH